MQLINCKENEDQKEKFPELSRLTEEQEKLIATLLGNWQCIEYIQDMFKSRYFADLKKTQIYQVEKKYSEGIEKMQQRSLERIKKNPFYHPEIRLMEYQQLFYDTKKDSKISPDRKLIACELALKGARKEMELIEGKYQEIKSINDVYNIVLSELSEDERNSFVRDAQSVKT